jgi:hypothetical protein
LQALGRAASGTPFTLHVKQQKPMASFCPHCNERIGVASMFRWGQRTPTWYVECSACGKPLEYSRRSRQLSIWAVLIATVLAIVSFAYQMGVWLSVPLLVAAYVVPHFFARFVPAQRISPPQSGRSVPGINLPPLNSSVSKNDSIE